MGAVAARIEDYAFIGDLQTGALVSRDGSIDWLCVPRFDSPACFASLLGTPENGRWQIRPDAEIREVRRRYLDGTLILETEFVCDGGSVAVIDFMPPRTSAPDLVRIVEGRRGKQAMAVRLLEPAPSVSVNRKVRDRKDPEAMVVIVEDVIKLLDSVSESLRRGHYPDKNHGNKVAQVLRAVAADLEL